MLYMHYEGFKLADVDAIKLIFSSSNTPSTYVSRSDWMRLEQIKIIFKQIPSAKRSYDPVTKIWILPDSILALLLVMPDLGKVEHNDLDAWLNPKAAQPEFKWYENANVKAEAPEDFFNNYAHASTNSLMSESELQVKLISIIKPLVNFDLNDRETFVRGYKLAARRLHPDVKGGNAALMSELNSLWMQYKEVVK